jgi:hypothetical protein
MTKARKKTSKAVTKKRQARDLKKRELTDEEKARLEAYEQRAGQTNPLKFKADARSEFPGGITATDPDEPLLWAKLAEAFGTTDVDAQGLLFDQVVTSFAGVTVVSDEHPDGFYPDKVIRAANEAAALLAGIGPRDELEAMLACQMVACHNAAMHTAKMAILTGQTFEGKRANTNYAVKLMALFTSQMEALKKYRTGGQQKMIVEHVNVNEGGQAVVGQVNMGGGGNRGTEGGPHAP